MADPSDLHGMDLTSRAPLGWKITSVCAFVALLETTATGMVGGALTGIQETFDLSDTLAGFIPTAAIVGSLAVAVASAHLADNARRVAVLAGGAVLWTLVALGSAVAPIFILFLASRALLGAAGQLNNPAAASLIADAHPAPGRAKAYGFERLANYLGLPLGIGIGGGLSSAFGWRTAFALMAVPGLFAAFLAWRTTEPARGLGDLLDRERQRAQIDADGSSTNSGLDGGDPSADGGLEYGGHASAKGGLDTNALADASPIEDSSLRTSSISTRLRVLWAVQTYRAIVVGLPVLFFGLGALFFWSTKYFEKTHGLAEDAAGGISGGVGGTGIMIGIIAGSRLGDRHHGTRAGWRLQLAALGLFGGAASFALMIALPGVAAQATFYGLANVGIAVAIPNLTAAVADVVPASIRGASFSTLQFCLALGTAAGPPLVGAASDIFGSLRPAMGLLVIPLAIAAVVVRSGARHYDSDARRAIGLIAG